MLMVPQYEIHHGIRLRRILRDKKFVLTTFAKLTGYTRPGLYDNFLKPKIKTEKLMKMLQAIPITLEEFLNWNSLNEQNTPHQGERLLLYFAIHKLKPKQVAISLDIKTDELYEWTDQEVLTAAQLQLLANSIQLDPAWFTNPQTALQEVNWMEAYLDKCMELQQCVRRLKALEKKQPVQV
ncbi:hypothetical protein SAMN05444266_107398 [Chitinophaga jiangningensis]|uniref:Uncharacterized protein n=1 Tax=Chitinophaga jiangningensis TaxID=1419482 RepID=A0A1M7HVG2_9BACT|nr:hypothetical protein [Chitinophaga jiangningensis]SHM32551.1 hypothetical protein SAMN05444266_107398 [Chitinophaga jiangningensis]